MTVRMVWCLGCGALWADPDCTCTCRPGGPRYEEWVVDPVFEAPGQLPYAP